KENADIYDFELTGADMRQVNRLNTGERVSHAPDVMYVRSEI
ncbi:aldo/keto reductase, partial [Listeria booriae]|nr:aldo/keto reductase [Listeria booriae]